MIYIWLDESDKKGDYYSNFYGGIIINSKDYEEINSSLMILLSKLEIKEEIKWQKVNLHNFERYKSVVDFIFDLLKNDKPKIRIFFRNNQYVAPVLTSEQKEQEFTILYYEFIKHGFGLQYCDYPMKDRHVRLFLDDIPARGSQIAIFKNFILGLNKDPVFKANGIKIQNNDIIEVDSSEHLLLQLLDLILGSICFRLNNKHLIKQADTGRRGKRTILKEKLYKYIYSKISEIRPGFNIGESTGFVSYKDNWEFPYKHWSFKPRNYIRDLSKSKHKNKKTLG